MRIMKAAMAVLFFLFVFMFTTLAWGQPCPPVDVNLSVADQAQTWWMVLLDFLVQLSAPFVTAILGVLGTWLVRKLTKKWDVEKQDAMVNLTNNLIASGVAFAEEQGRKALRSGKPRTKGADKLGMATDYIQRQLDSSGLPGIAEEELVKLIEARLQQERSKPDGIVPDTPAENGDQAEAEEEAEAEE
jgi:hypothetical protein